MLVERFNYEGVLRLMQFLLWNWSSYQCSLGNAEHNGQIMNLISLPLENSLFLVLRKEKVVYRLGPLLKEE